MASDSRSGKSAPQNEILINASAGETRVAIMELGHFAELYIERERDRDRSVAGMVALGRVTRVLPGMQAAFVDIGLEKAAFLYVGDYLDEAAALSELGAEEEPAPRRRGRDAMDAADATATTASRSGSTRCSQRGRRSSSRWPRIRSAARARALPPTSRSPAGTWCSRPGPRAWASRDVSTGIASAGACARS